MHRPRATLGQSLAPPTLAECQNAICEFSTDPECDTYGMTNLAISDSCCVCARGPGRTKPTGRACCTCMGALILRLRYDFTSQFSSNYDMILKKGFSPVAEKLHLRLRSLSVHVNEPKLPHLLCDFGNFLPYGS